MSDWAIELNADVGEGGSHDREIVTLVQRANVCLGAHAGSPELTQATVALCREKDRLFCGHPGYPDREAFGRRPYQLAGLSLHHVRDSLLDQVSSWKGQLDSLKPHGAFYHDSQHVGPEFNLLVELLRACDVPLLGMAGTAHEEAAAQAEVAFVPEGFADRGYSPTGQLLPRGTPGCFVRLDELPAHLAWVVPRVRSLCVHGDGDHPVERLTAVRSWLATHGVEVTAWKP